MTELKKLDIGYGYTSDRGKTFPFRGKGIGMMPSLEEVLQAFPDRSLLINIKSNDPSEGEKLAAALGHLAPERRSQLMAYGGDKPIAVLARLLPDVRAMSRGSLKACLISYIAYGWTGFVPQACSHTLVFVPVNVAPWLWGWPDRFLIRMKSAGSPVFVLGPYYGGDFSTGMDTPADIARLPDGYSGGVLTNEIEMVSRELKSEGR
jgi:glycerophosphoryl diester phosphodiesterase